MWVWVCECPALEAVQTEVLLRAEAAVVEGVDGTGGAVVKVLVQPQPEPATVRPNLQLTSSTYTAICN